jgi:hypothetical protein
VAARQRSRARSGRSIPPRPTRAPTVGRPTGWLPLHRRVHRVRRSAGRGA